MYFIGEICLVMMIGLIEMKLASRNNSTRWFFYSFKFNCPVSFNRDNW
jgi:hypothetical protein